MDIENKIFW